MSHFILENAHRYNERTSDLKPRDAFYNEQAGYWIGNAGDVLINNDGFGELSTKKCDRETGEDQKGE